MAELEVKFTTAPKMVVADLERRGPYSGRGDTMRTLKEWIDSKGIEQAGYPFCLFYDDPAGTKKSEQRSEACIPVGKPFEPEGEFKVKELGEVIVAEARHSGPPEEFGMTYRPLLEELRRQGYEVLGPPREYFMAASEVRGQGAGFLIQQPVAKKQHA